jgi:uncharacterized protein (DUF697 family)
MAGISSIANAWNNVKEVDLRPIRQEALKGVKIAIAGASGTGRTALAEQMRRDPSRPGVETQTPVLILEPDSAGEAEQADLVILLLDPRAGEFEREKSLTKSWSNSGKKVLVFVNQSLSAGRAQALKTWVDWGQRHMVHASVEDSNQLLSEFVPVVIELLPEHLLALGRDFPLFRVPIAHHLINETSFSNATYALSTGLAEVVPVLNLPLNVADMIVLTKAQAFLVYRLGLALGLSTQWQEYVSEFGGVLGGGFLWRQLARSLVGLIPAWGIVPKVAVAYSGTYVVGNAILQWYLTGRHISRKQMQALYRQAFDRGKAIAGSLAQKVPRPRLGRRSAAALPAPAGKQVCSNCGRKSDTDSGYCQYCGQKFEPPVAGSADAAG